MRVLFIGAAWPAIMPIILSFSHCPSMLISSQTQMGKNSNGKEDIMKQAGAELGQAQLLTGIWLYFDSHLLHYIDLSKFDSSC